MDSQRQKFSGLMIWGLLAVGFCFYNLINSDFLFWGDEVYSFNYARQPLFEFIKQYFWIHADNHPPLFYLISNIWHKLWGVTPARDWLFRSLSMIFHFCSIWYINRFYLKKDGERVLFTLLAVCSSFFLLYSRMFRYYSLAAFLMLIIYDRLIRYISSEESIYRRDWLAGMVILLWTDYPTFLYMFLISGVLLYRNAKIKKVVTSFPVMVISAIPLLLINMKDVMFHVRLTEYIGAFSQAPKLIIGFLFPLYHYMIGDYLNQLQLVFILPLMGWALWTAWMSESPRERNLMIGLLLINTLVLTLFIKRYPVFSYARFICFGAYLLWIILSREIHRRQGIYYLLFAGLIGINLLSGYHYLRMNNFINPIYFVPYRNITQLISTQVQTDGDLNYYAPVPDTLNWYVGYKFYNNRLTDTLSSGRQYVMLKPMRLFETSEEFSAWQQDFKQTHHVEIRCVIGFDNMSPSPKILLRRLGWMKIPFKYYLIFFNTKS